MFKLTFVILLIVTSMSCSGGGGDPYNQYRNHADFTWYREGTNYVYDASSSTGHINTYKWSKFERIIVGGKPISIELILGEGKLLILTYPITGNINLETLNGYMIGSDSIVKEVTW